MRFITLQALRAVAASLVVFGHALHTYADKIGSINFHYNLGYGELGVQVFFCISGFIVYRSTQNTPATVGASLDFMVRRVLRIFPIYWVATLIYAGKLVLEGNAPTVGELISSLFFIPYINPDDGLMRPVLGVGWSLNYEMFFYVLLALAIPFKASLRFISVALVLIGFLAVNALRSESQGSVDVGFQLLATEWLLYFIVGMAIAHFSVPRLWQVSESLVVSLFTLLLISYLLVKSFVPFNDAMLLLSGLLIAAVSVAMCIAHSPANTEKNYLSHRLMDVFNLSGDASYSTYLFHSFVLGVSGRIVAKIGLAIDPFVFAAIMVVLSTIAGIVIYVLLERPMTRWLHQQWRQLARDKVQLIR